jgi:nucleotide-binding universal stress UspA family protein
MILIAYDGSDDAKAALEHAGALFSGQPAIVVTVWEPFSDLLARTPASMAVAAGIEDTEEIDEASHASAQEQAEEGAGAARAAGLDASGRTRCRSGSVAQAILAEAEHANASAVVMGSRGLGGIGSLLLGSVSHAVLQHADRPVVVVPSPAVARSRNEKLRADAGRT